MSRAEGFAAIPNWMMRDKTISRSAVIVYASLASRSGLGGIHPSQATIAEESGLSVRTVRTMLAELEALGVVQRVRRTSDARGRGNRLPDGYTLHPNGRLDHAAEIADSSMQPANDDDATGNMLHGLLYKAEPVEVDKAKPGFAEFYLAYPKKVGKEAARRAFEKAAKTTDPAVIVEAARRYAADPSVLADRKFIPYPASWLNAGRWDDESETPAGDPEQSPAVDEVTRARDEWLRRHGITYDDYLEHVDEPGWLENLERSAR